MSEYLPYLDVWVTQTALPSRVRAFCQRPEGNNVIILNGDLNDEAKLKAVRHELLHLQRNDLDSDKSVEEIEAHPES